MNFAEEYGVSDKKFFAVRDQVIAKALEFEKKDVSKDFFLSQTAKFKAMFSDSKKTDQEIMDEIYIEAYATCYLAIKESMKDKGITPYDVQIEAALVMKDQNIAEMKTGEGKTIAGLMPIYLKALCGKGMHVMTSNEYLSKRDYEESKKTFELLGLTTGLLPKRNQKDKSNTSSKKQAYNCDITYGEVREFVFDDLRDKTVRHLDEQVSYGKHSYAVLDEIDSFLIDESLSPCVLSKTTSDDDSKFVTQELKIAKSIIDDPEFKAYFIKDDELGKMNEGLRRVRTANYGCVVSPSSVEITEKGSKIIYDRIRRLSSVLPPEMPGVDNSILWEQTVKTLLRSMYILKKGVHYDITEDDEKKKKISLYTPSTGRISANKRYSNGEQECLEFLNGLEISAPGITSASITYPSFFGQYLGFSGMTGTAKSEANEFLSQYDLGMRQIRERIPGKLKDNGYIIYNTEEEKINAILTMVLRKSVVPGRSALIGTTSSTTADKIAAQFELAFRAKNFRFPMEVLSGTQSQDEAEKIAKAGKPRSITIATNMAGRGTDIKLDDSVVKAHDKSDEAEAGLMVVLSDFYLDERIHDQFVGRAARKGQPGSAVTILSMEDPIIKYLGIKLLSQEPKKGMPIEPRTTDKIVKELEKYRRQDRGLKQNTRIRSNYCGKVEQKVFKEVYDARQTILSEKNLLGLLTDLAPTVAQALNRQVEDNGISRLMEYWNPSEVIALKSDYSKNPETLAPRLEQKYLESLGEMDAEKVETIRMEALKSFDTAIQKTLEKISLMRTVSQLGNGNIEKFLTAYYKDLSQEMDAMMDEVKTGIAKAIVKSQGPKLVNEGKMK